MFDALKENRACVHRKWKNVFADLRNEIREDGQTFDTTKDEGKKKKQSIYAQAMEKFYYNLMTYCTGNASRKNFAY